MKQDPVITTNALTIGYLLKGGRRKVVHEGLDLQLRAGEVTCLLGLNGAGKSTLLRTLCGFQPALQGEIYLSGKALDNYFVCHDTGSCIDRENECRRIDCL